MLQLKSISPSRIKTFDMCRFKYWLTYHRKDIQLKTNWGAVHGTLIHDILEAYVLGVDRDWRRRLYDGYAGRLVTKNRWGKDEVMESPLVWAKPKEYDDVVPYCDTCPFAEDGKCSISDKPLDNLPGCPRDLFEQSVLMVDEVIRRYDDNIWPKVLASGGKPIGCEYQFKLTIPGTNVPMIGIMDLVVAHGDTVEIIDYKTGVWTQDESECQKDIQVRMYSLASRREFIDDVNNKGHKFKHVFLTFDYFKSKPISVCLSEEDDLSTERFVAQKIHEIQSTSEIRRVVPEGCDFSDRSHWKCRSLCDPVVCQEEWMGVFEV